MSRVVRALDARQRRHPFLAFPWAVVCKYADDDGARVAALITYYGFLSLFPLLLLAVAVVSELLRSQPELRQQVLDHLVTPALRPEVEEALTRLPPSGVPLAVGLIGLLLAGTGGVLAVYAALNRVWNVPWRIRFGMVRRYVRVFVVLLLSFLCAVLAAGSATAADVLLPLLVLQRAAAAIATGAAVFAMIVVAHKALVCRPLRVRDVWPGALLGAAAVTVLLNLAALILPILIGRAGVVYGGFATVVGIFTLLYLISQALVLGVEVSTVVEARLWPRGLTDADLTDADLTDADLTDADRRALELQARRQERVPGQRVTTTFAGTARPSPPQVAVPASSGTRSPPP
jgi:uncharacterized BrkB/YihY/UPF0761 family membrane protein